MTGHKAATRVPAKAAPKCITFASRFHFVLAQRRKRSILVWPQICSTDIRLIQGQDRSPTVGSRERMGMLLLAHRPLAGDFFTPS
jgi:hypothetical protein